MHDLHIVRQSARLALEPVSFDETAAWRRSQLPDTDTDPSRCTCAKDGYTDRARLARCGIVQYSYVATYCRACLSVDVLLSEGKNRDRHGYITGALPMRCYVIAVTTDVSREMISRRRDVTVHISRVSVDLVTAP